MEDCHSTLPGIYKTPETPYSTSLKRLPSTPVMNFHRFTLYCVGVLVNVKVYARCGYVVHGVSSIIHQLNGIIFVRTVDLGIGRLIWRISLILHGEC